MVSQHQSTRAAKKGPLVPFVVACLAVLGSVITPPVSAEVCVTDDIQQHLCLDDPANRIISLSPGATELLFAAGAANKVIAAVAFSDFPEAAKAIPRIGSYDRIDMEAVLANRPDLIVAWKEGNPKEQVAQLRELGIPVYHGDQRDFDDIASSIRRLGSLAGTVETARRTADDFLARIDALRQRYADAPRVSTFYQVWVNPLMTASKQHFIGHAIDLCAGDNIFGELSRLTPRISVESVLTANPEVIIAGGMAEDDPGWLNQWRAYPRLHAVQKDNLFFVPPSTLQRPSPRLAEGIATLCEHLDTARGRR